MEKTAALHFLRLCVSRTGTDDSAERDPENLRKRTGDVFGHLRGLSGVDHCVGALVCMGAAEMGAGVLFGIDGGKEREGLEGRYGSYSLKLRQVVSWFLVVAFTL